MTYGLKVFNNNGREVINSDITYMRNLKLPSSVSNIAAPGGDTNNTTNNASTFAPSTNLILVRPNSTSSLYDIGASVTRYYFNQGTQTLDTNIRYMSDYQFYKYRGPGTYNVLTTSVHSAPATRSEYGLEVFDANGDTQFVTQDFDSSFDIVFSGYASAQETTFSSLDWKTDTNLYVMLNSCYHTYSAVSGIAAGEYETFIGYVFLTNGSLVFKQEVIVEPQSGTDSIQALPQLSGNAYLVVRVKS